MPYCYVPSYDDLCKAKSKHKSFKSTTTTTANPNESDKATTATNNLGMDHAAVDSQIDFFNKASLSSLSSDLSKDTPVVSYVAMKYAFSLKISRADDEKRIF